jgi:hypothetical protein
VDTFVVARGAFVEEKAAISWAGVEETPTMTYLKPMPLVTSFVEEKAAVLWAGVAETPTMIYLKPIPLVTSDLMQH